MLFFVFSTINHKLVVMRKFVFCWHFFKLLILGLLIEVFHGLQRQKVDGWDLHNVHLGLAETICAKGVFNSLANP